MKIKNLVEEAEPILIMTRDEPLKNGWYDVKMYKSPESEKYLVMFKRDGYRSLGAIHPDSDKFYKGIEDYRLLDVDEANRIYKEATGKNL